MPEARRPLASSLGWLAALVALAFGAALLSGAVLYRETHRAWRVQARAMTGGDPDLGRQAIARFGCGGCHAIPGITGAAGRVGPDLAHLAHRTTLAGHLSNDPASLERWLMHPQAVHPGCGMPEMGVSPMEARDMAAYLYTLH